MKTVYLAGKISGCENYREKFDNAQRHLEQHGYVCLNPAWLPPTGLSYESYLSIGKAMLRECECVCLLPDYKDSEGAMAELELARELDKEIFELGDI